MAIRALIELLSRSYRLARRFAIGVIGVSVVLVGIAMIVLPGPAIIVIPLGLAILGSEFAWARRWLHFIKEKSRRRVRPNDG